MAFGDSVCYRHLPVAAGSCGCSGDPGMPMTDKRRAALDATSIHPLRGESLWGARPKGRLSRRRRPSPSLSRPGSRRLWRSGPGLSTRGPTCRLMSCVASTENGATGGSANPGRCSAAIIPICPTFRTPNSPERTNSDSVVHRSRVTRRLIRFASYALGGRRPSTAILSIWSRLCRTILHERACFLEVINGGNQQGRRWARSSASRRVAFRSSRTRSLYFTR